MVVKAEVILFTLLIIFSLGACSPYSSKFSCPGTYGGVCESMQDAYEDSVAGVDPRQFDTKYQEKKRKWEEANKELIEARKQAKGRGLEEDGEAPGYRKALFEELKNVISAPTTPILIPPTVQRALVLGHANGKVFTAPHYIFFILDEPKWVLGKLPEQTVSVDRKEPVSTRESDSSWQYDDLIDEEVSFD